MKIERFVLMAGYTYYASGGFEDFNGSFELKEEADAAMAKFFEENPDYTWAHIADLEEGTISGKGSACNPMKLFR